MSFTFEAQIGLVSSIRAVLQVCIYITVDEVGAVVECEDWRHRFSDEVKTMLLLDCLSAEMFEKRDSLGGGGVHSEDQKHKHGLRGICSRRRSASKNGPTYTGPGRRTQLLSHLNAES
eukprot:GFKZ01010263.1.p1 GENE.GFKZ01010263.1~~GFKZ01010263.1.p1  ORF type:complete len:118 (-),score=5.87 GFKZ01010263.1:271-624(-)